LATLVGDWAPKMESLFKAADSRAEVAEFDVDFCFFNINLGNGLVVKEYFVELNESLLKVIVL
jgi:hypothetical protein